jgi:hypothetical protein
VTGEQVLRQRMPSAKRMTTRAIRLSIPHPLLETSDRAGRVTGERMTDHPK